MQQHVGDRELVDVVAERTQLAHQRGLERRHGMRGDRAAGERAADALGMERSGIHLVVREPAQQPALRDLGPLQADDLTIAFEPEIGAVEQAAYTGEIGFQGGLADVQPIGRGVHIDAVGFVEQHPHDGVQAIARCGLPRRPRAQGRMRARTGAVSGRSGLDRVAACRAGVEGGHVGANAARRHTEQIGEARRRRPLVLPEKGLQELILTLARHAPMMPAPSHSRGAAEGSAGAERNLVAPLTASSQNGGQEEVASMRILVVCGAGASSTFVAQRLRRAASAAGLDWDTSAGTEQTISTAFADLVLVGPHLADRLDAIRSASSAPVAVLPDDVFADHDGVRTLAAARASLPSSTNEPPSTAKGTS